MVLLQTPHGDIWNFNIQLERIKYFIQQANKTNYFLLFWTISISLDIKRFYGNIFQHGVIPMISKHTRVTAEAATLILDP